MIKDRYLSLLAHYTVEAPAPSGAAAHEVARRVTDSIGVMAAALDDDAPHAARAMAGHFELPNGATIFGSDKQGTPELAGFANGVHVRYLDFNDTYLSREPLHPSDVIPALLALGEWAGLNGQQLVESIAVAYQVGITLCDAASPRAYGWDHVIYITIATACGASRLLELSAEQTANAIALAIVPHSAMRETRSGELSMWKGAAASNAARHGVFAALLSREGFTGPELAFTGKMGVVAQIFKGEPIDDVALAPLSPDMRPDRILDSYIKKYPVEYHAQSAVDVALDLHARLADPSTITAVEIDTFQASYEIIAQDPEKWHPRTRETADHSLPYIVAVALLDGEVTRESFSPERIADPRIHELLERTSLRSDLDLTALYPASGIPNRVTVHTADGTVVQGEENFPRGHAGNPMDDEEVRAKFHANLVGRLDESATERLLDLCWGIGELTDLRTLTAAWPGQATE